jgi:predicted dehydrogenase
MNTDNDRAMTKEDFGLRYLPEPALRKDLGIAIVGAGGIVNAAHLPAYRQAGFKVVGVTDVDQERAQQTAVSFEIEKVYSDLDELLDDNEVTIVDIAVPPFFQFEIACRVIESGKHLLCQKPLSDQFPRAVELTKRAQEANVKLAVNQQMRWDQAIRASRDFIRRGWLGEPTGGGIWVSINTGWKAWPWLVESDHLDFMYHSIHYFDSIRSLFGEPDRVSARMARLPDQLPKAETRTWARLDFGDRFSLTVDTNHGNWTDDLYAIFRWEGTEGLVKGTFGALYNYPHGRPDTLEYFSKRFQPHHWIRRSFEEMWIPHSFEGPMADLMNSIAEDREPETSGQDHLKTLAIVFACYESAETGKGVDLFDQQEAASQL